LSGSVLTSGTVADARLSSNIPKLDSANTFTKAFATGAHAIQIRAATPLFSLWESASPADSRLWRHYVSAQQYLIVATDDAETTNLAVPITLNRSGDLAVGRDLFEKGRSAALGHWTSVAFASGNFTADGGATWTISTQFVNRYTVIGKTLAWTLSVAGSVNLAATNLFIALPFGSSTSGYGLTRAAYASSVGVETGARGFVASGGTTLQIVRSPAATWAVGDASVQFTAIIQIS
jgi:hypothetical protein